VSANAEVEAVETNGKPAKGAPVIRRVEVAEEDVGSRVLNRHVPAWVISGAIHVVVIGSLVGFMHGPQDVKAKENNPVTTQVDEPNEEQKNLTNADVGFDADLAATTNANREENVNVDAKPAQDPVGLPEQPSDIAPNTAAMGLMQDAGIGSKDLSDTGLTMAGPGGGASAFMTPGMSSRVSGATRDRLLKTGGGNTESEAAPGSSMARPRTRSRPQAWLCSRSSRPGRPTSTGPATRKRSRTG
jgi:hypothetical protein